MLKCPYCRSDIFVNDITVSCQACSTQYHADCWSANLRCSVFGCSSVYMVDEDLIRLVYSNHTRVINAIRQLTGYSNLAVHKVAFANVYAVCRNMEFLFYKEPQEVGIFGKSKKYMSEKQGQELFVLLTAFNLVRLLNDDTMWHIMRMENKNLLAEQVFDLSVTDRSLARSLFSDLVKSYKKPEKYTVFEYWIRADDSPVDGSSIKVLEFRTDDPKEAEHLAQQAATQNHSIIISNRGRRSRYPKSSSTLTKLVYYHAQKLCLQIPLDETFDDAAFNFFENQILYRLSIEFGSFLWNLYGGSGDLTGAASAFEREIGLREIEETPE